MAKYLILLCLLCANAHSKPIEELADDAQKALEELKTIVLVEILTGEKNLYLIYDEWKWNANYLAETSQAKVEIKDNAIKTQLDGIKALADADELDISICLNENEGPIYDWKNEYLLEVLYYHQQILADVQNIMQHAISKIVLKSDVVAKIGEKLNKCENDECLKSIIEEIERSKIKIPQDIATLVDSSEVSLLKILDQIQSDLDDKVATYTSKGDGILSNITTCVNNLEHAFL